MDYVIDYGSSDSIIGNNVDYRNRLFDLALSLLVIFTNKFYIFRGVDYGICDILDMKHDFECEDGELLGHHPIETEEGLYVIAPYLIGQKIAFKLYHEWLEDELRDEEDNTIAWGDAKWRIDEEIADIRGTIMSGIKDMLEQNNLYII